MTWMLPASICILVAMLIMAIAFGYLYAVYRERHLSHWALASCFSSVRYLALILQVTLGKSPGLAAVYNGTTVFAALLMLWGAELLARSERSRWVLWLSAAFAAWGVYGPYAGLSAPVIAIPIFFFLGTAYILVGALVLKSWPRPRPAVVIITSTLFILWGIHQYDYPVLRFVEWFAPIGYGIGGTFTLATSLGIIIMYFERMRRELADSANNFRGLFEGSPVPTMVEDFSAVKTELDALKAAHGANLRNHLVTNPGEVARLAALVHINDINDKTAEVLGAASKEEVWRTLPQYFDERSLESFREELAALAIGASSFVTEIPVRDMHGRDRQLLLSLTVPEGHEEKLDRVFVSFMDITERKRAEEELLESQERFMQVAEAAQEIIWEVDKDGLYTYVSPGILAVTGYEPEEVVGKMHYYDLHPEGMREEFKQAASEIFKRRGEFRRFLNPIETKNGGIVWVETNGLPHVGKDGEVLGYRGLDADVTERRKVEEQLRQAQKMEAIGTLAGGIAHDFNNILGAIMGYAEITQAKLAEGSEEAENLAEVVSASLRARDLVRQILLYSRQAGVEKRVVELAPVIGEALKLIRATLPSTITVTTDVDPAAGSVLADPSQIHQIVMNLCANAFEAMRDQGGRLSIRVRACKTCPGEVETTGENQGCALIEVSDTGVGMDQATLARIFEPYFTTRGLGKGTGLGLATVQGIVRDHGGKIEVESELRKGSTFRIHLPRAAAPAEREALRLKECARGSGRVLVVDDEPALARLAAKMLESVGFKADWRTDSGEALTAFAADPAAYDAVVTDQTMPNMTGLELAGRIKDLRPDIPIVLCSGYSDIIDEESAKMRVDVDGYVAKPMDRLKLGEAVSCAIEERGKAKQ